MDQVTKVKGWFEQNSQRFSSDMNGFREPPVLSYVSCLPFVDSDGQVLDAGSGNGMLLKFIMDFSDHKIVPHGIDRNPDAIHEARQKVLPEYSKNFIVAEIDKCIPLEQRFNIIICNPFHSVRPFHNLVDLLKDMLYPNGKIIIRIHDDVLAANKILSIAEAWRNSSVPISFSRGADVSYGVIRK